MSAQIVEPTRKYGASTIASAMLRLQVGDHMAELTLPISRLPFVPVVQQRIVGGLVAGHIQADQPAARSSMPFGQQGPTAGEVTLLEIDQPIEPKLQRRAVAAGSNRLFGGHEIDMRDSRSRPRCAPY